MTELEQTVADRKLSLEARLEAIAGTRRLCVIEEDGVREELAEIAAFSKLLEASKATTTESTLSDQILALLADRGAMRGADIAAAIAVVGIRVTQVGGALTHLRRQKKVVRVGDMWGAR